MLVTVDENGVPLINAVLFLNFSSLLLILAFTFLLILVLYLNTYLLV